MTSSQFIESLNCPFCLNHKFERVPGKTLCPICLAEFEIDDRGESVYMIVDKPAIPVIGVACSVCGLIQKENETCISCGTKLNITIH